MPMKPRRKGSSTFSPGSWNRCVRPFGKEFDSYAFSGFLNMLLTYIQAQRRQHPIGKHSRSRVRIPCQQTFARIVRIEDRASSITATTATTESTSVPVPVASRAIFTISTKQQRKLVRQRFHKPRYLPGQPSRLQGFYFLRSVGTGSRRTEC